MKQHILELLFRTSQRIIPKLITETVHAEPGIWFSVFAIFDGDYTYT
jgi:hypothetical protein